jgi:hypothetical protein
MTKRAVLPLLMLTAALPLAPAATPGQEFPGNPSFKHPKTPAAQALASLAGCWVGKNPWGSPARLTYDLASDATVLIEYLEQQGQVPMYTAIYFDGETPMLHHYCSYGSQIRMRAQPSADGKVIHFAFLDATNIKSLEDDDHMTYEHFTFRDHDHIDVEWGVHLNHKDLRQIFPFTRVTQGCDTRHSNVWN